MTTRLRTKTTCIDQTSPRWPGLPRPEKRKGRLYHGFRQGADGLHYRVEPLGHVLICYFTDEVFWRWSPDSGLERWSDCPGAFDEQDFASRLVTVGERSSVYPRHVAEATPEQLRYMSRFAALIHGTYVHPNWVNEDVMTADELPGWEFVRYSHDHEAATVWVSSYGNYRGFWQKRDGWTFLREEDRDLTLAQLGPDFVEGF